jgi:signal transduction histidine kinase
MTTHPKHPARQGAEPVPDPRLNSAFAGKEKSLAENAENGAVQARASQVSTARSLSTKLLLLTTLFVLIAEVLIFVPSVANFRLQWLQERISTAEIASIVFIADRDLSIPNDVQTEILSATGADAIVVRVDGESRLIARSSMPPTINVMVNLVDWTGLQAIEDAFGTLFASENRSLRVIAEMNSRNGTLEVLLREQPLREAMLIYARNVTLISIVIGLFTAALVFLAINGMIIRPVRHLSRNMVSFAEAPDDTSRIMKPSKRRDEMGIAERQLALMQGRLNETLRQQKRLADLGLAVSKINHDLRNILASAQLFSDALSDVDDPMVKKFAPRIFKALDRATVYTQSVLAYGKAQDAAPEIQKVELHSLVNDVRDNLAFPDGVAFSNLVSENFHVDADPEQLFRVIHNLSRNAMQALEACEDVDGAVHSLSVCARRETGREDRADRVVIIVGDSGPGVQERARESLFQAFKGSTTTGGTGLGLAIAAECVRAHGGEIRLLEDGDQVEEFGDSCPGAKFEISLPLRD